MKKRLDQYTVSQFIDIACGDYSSIDADTETAKHVAASLMEQYNNASDPVSAKARLLEEENFSRCKAKSTLYRILLNLINVYGAYDDVRDVLNLTGNTNVASRDDESLKGKLEQMLRSEEGSYERIGKERRESIKGEPSEEAFRAFFDRQTAWLMTHFKFSISHETMSASVYANLVHTAQRQQRQQAAK